MRGQSATTRKAFKLDKLGFVGRGRSRHRPRNDPGLYGGPYPFFQTGDIKAAEFYLSEHTQTYNENGLSQSKLWESGTLCITIAANIAETAILKARGCFPDSVVGFVADPAKADVRLIKYYIDTVKLQMQSVSKGTTQDNLSLDKLLNFDFILPPVGEQRKIASVLSAYDVLVENNNRRIKILEEMAQMIYREWFVKFRFPGHEKVKMINSSLGKIPQGWQVVNLQSILQCVRNGTKPGGHLSNRNYVPIDCIPRRSLCLLGAASWREAKSSLQLFDEGDILFGAMRPYFHKVVIAPFDGVTRTTCFVLRPTSEKWFSYSVMRLFQDDTIQYASAHSQGATIPYAVWAGSVGRNESSSAPR